jgi:hypothetical protein
MRLSLCRSDYSSWRYFLIGNMNFVFRLLLLRIVVLIAPGSILDRMRPAPVSASAILVLDSVADLSPLRRVWWECLRSLAEGFDEVFVCDIAVVVIVHFRASD